MEIIISQEKKKTKRAASQSRSTSGARRSSQHAGKKSKRRKKRRTSPLLVTLIVCLALVLCVFGGMAIYMMRYSNYDKILPNVYVAGVDVGGMTKDEAKAAIESTLSQTTQQSVNVNLPDRVVTFTPQQDTLLIDIDQAVDEAYSYGRLSTNPFTMARAIQAAERRRNDIDVSSALQVDTTYIRDLIDSTAAETAQPLVETQVSADVSAHTVTATIGTPGRSLNTEELYNLVASAFANANYSDIDYDYQMSYPAEASLDEAYAQVEVEAKDAKYDPDSGEIEAEQNGYAPETSLEDANEQLAQAASGETLTFYFVESEPKVTASELEEMMFRDVLSSAATSYWGGTSGRTTNVRLATEAVNGTVIQPGETFSFNDTVGERTADKGYQEAIVYVSGKSESELGGGVCQVASTLYYCAMYADLEIVERAEHQFIVDYVPGGLDATVYFGAVDFRFRNDTDYPIRIDAWLEDGDVNVDFVGTNVDGTYVEIETECVQTIPFSTVTVTNSDEVQSGYTGYVYEITRYVYDADGNLIRTDTTEDLDELGDNGLGTSHYDKRDKKVLGSSSSGGSSSTTPSPSASAEPSTEPSAEPTVEPTPEPTVAPTPEPTVAPEPDPEPVPDPGPVETTE